MQWKNSWPQRIRNAFRLFWWGLRDSLRANVEVSVGAHRFRFERVLYNPTMRVYLTAEQLKVVYQRAQDSDVIEIGEHTFTHAQLQALIAGFTATHATDPAKHKPIPDEVIDEIIDVAEGKYDILPEHLR